MTEWLSLATALLVILAAFVELIVQSRQFRNIRNELEGTKAVIRDTADLRRVLRHKIEGSWVLAGTLSRFQGNYSPHMSEGFLVLTWRPELKRYDAIYVYSVTKLGDARSLTTNICTGRTLGDVDPNSLTIELELTVQARTDWENKPNYNRHFKLKITVDKGEEPESYRTMESDWESPGTSTRMRFTRTD